MAVPVIFDTDAGSDIDDLYAMALILRHPNLELIGVTTVAGDTQARARLVAKMLRLAGRKDVPVFAGIRIPPALVKRGVEASGYRQNLTHTDLVREGDPEFGREYGDAVDFILKTLDHAARPVVLIGTGPWTNIAEVVSRADAKQKSMIECLALMGGETHLLHSECNVKNDPEGADVVLRAGLPLFMGTWNVTRQLYFSMAEVDALIEGKKSAFLQALREATHLWWGKGRTEKPGPVCYDVIPVFWAADERKEISCIRLRDVVVELTGEYTRGMTVTTPQQIVKAERTGATSPGYLIVTDSVNVAPLKKRFTELVFK